MTSATDAHPLGSTRSSKSRSWIIAAFNHLVLGRPYDSLSIRDVSRRAGVGRSTFYEHFRDKDDVLRHAIGPVLAPLADAAVGSGDARSVQSVLDHIASIRHRAASLLDGPTRSQVERTLTDLILARLVNASPEFPLAMLQLEAAGLAGAQVSVLRAWLQEHTAAFASARVAELLTRSPFARAVAAPRIQNGLMSANTRSDRNEISTNARPDVSGGTHRA